MILFPPFYNKIMTNLLPYVGIVQFSKKIMKCFGNISNADIMRGALITFYLFCGTTKMVLRKLGNIGILVNKIIILLRILS